MDLGKGHFLAEHVANSPVVTIKKTLRCLKRCPGVPGGRVAVGSRALVGGRVW